MSLIRELLEYVYCSNLLSNHVLIRLIRFVSRFTTHLCIAIYFLTIFNTLYNRFTKILHFAFWNLNESSNYTFRTCKSHLWIREPWSRLQLPMSWWKATACIHAETNLACPTGHKKGTVLSPPIPMNSHSSHQSELSVSYSSQEVIVTSEQG